MAWVDEWGLVLGGIDSMFYNIEQRLKAPFREKLRQKYAKKYNDADLMLKIAEDTKDIHLFCRHYSHMSTGNGLFLLNLFREYERKGKKVKLIMAGSKKDSARFFEDELDYSVTEMDAKDEKWESSFENSIYDSKNVLTISESMSYSKKYDNKPSFFSNILKKITSLPKNENIIYIVTTLFIHDKDAKETLKSLSEEEHIRIVHFQLDFPNFRLSENDWNLFFPHYGDRRDSKDIYQKLEKVFPAVPSWLFKKKYYGYFFFIYHHQGKEGMFFMDLLEKPENYKW